VFFKVCEGFNIDRDAVQVERRGYRDADDPRWDIIKILFSNICLKFVSLIFAETGTWLISQNHHKIFSNISSSVTKPPSLTLDKSEMENID
jgi:hypothetical protein